MEYLKAALSQKAQFRQPMAVSSQYPQYFSDKAEEDEFSELYKEWTKPKEEGDPHNALPRFYFNKKASEVPEQLKLLEVSRELHLTQKTAESVENTELELLWNELQKFARLDEKGNLLMNYDDFCGFRHAMLPICPKFDPCFTPSIFMMLPQDSLGRISANTFFDFVIWKIHLHRTRLSLCLYDSAGNGLLTEKDLEAYILDQIPSFPQLQDLDEAFYLTYVVYAVRKFFFFLDPTHRGIIKIQDIMASDILAEFRDLKEEELDPAMEASNWFSVSSVMRVHGEYIQLDADKSGLLDEHEFAHFNQGTLTPAIVNRVFQECTSYRGQIDYKVYLDFVLAREYPATPQALRYFFRLLDVNHQNYLDFPSINFFWKSLQRHPMLLGLTPVALTDVVNEIFDMVKPTQPDRITVQDLIRCGKGHTVCSILSDANGFMIYESREETPPEGEDQ